MEKILDKVSKRIRELRKINKLSQEKLAEKADVHPTYIGKIERAEMNPSIVFLEKIAKGLNVSLAELFTFPDDKKLAKSKASTLDKAIELLEIARELGESYKAKED